METVGRKEHIVVLGAGIGGLATALRLERFAKTANCNVTVIDRDRFHCYHALLYQSATAFGLAHPQRDALLRSSAMVPVCGLPHSALLNELHMIRGEILGIDRGRREISLRDGTTVHYDTVIFALGSVSNDFGIRGVREFTVALRNEHDAEVIREQLVNCRERAAKGETVRCLIAGAGVSGVEIAGACGAEIQSLVQMGKIQQHHFQIEMIEASPSVLPGFPPAAQAAVTQRLVNLGVNIRCGTTLAEVRAHTAVYQDGSTENYDLILWCGGLLGHPLLEHLRGTMNKKRQLEVNSFFQMPQDEHVYGIGDAVTAVDPKTHTQLPQTASVAVAEGRFVADHILARLLGRPSKEMFIAPNAPIAIPIGHRFGIFIKGKKVTVGLWGWVERKWLDWKYFRSIAPWQSAWEMFRRGFFPPLG